MLHAATANVAMVLGDEDVDDGSGGKGQRVHQMTHIWKGIWLNDRSCFKSENSASK